LDLWTGDGEFLRAVAKLNQESQKLVGIDLGPESEIIQDGNTEIEIRSFNTQGENWQQVIEQDEHDIVTLNYPDSSKLIDLVSVLELAAHGLKPEGICCVVLEPGDEVERVKIAMEGLFDSERIYTVDLPEEWPRSEYSLRNILREGHKMIVAVRPKVQLEPTAPAEVEVLEPETKEVAVTTVVSFDWSAFLHIWKSDRGFKKYVLDLMQRKDMRLVINSEGDKDLIRERLHEYYKEMGIDYEMEPEEIDIITVFPRGMRRPENKPQALNNWLKRRGIKPTVVIHVDDSDKDLMDFGYSLGLFKEAEVTTVGVSSSGGYSRHEIAPAGFSGKFDDILRSL